MVKKYYAPQALIEDAKTLLSQIEGSYDAILAVARGGLSLAHLLAQALDLRTVFSVNVASYDATVQRDHVVIEALPNLSFCKKILIVEDIIDSGKSMLALTQQIKAIYPDVTFEVAALFYKPTAVYKPHYYARIADSWIDFYWEVDLM